MSAKSIFEADGKAILNYHLTRAPVIKPTPLPASSTHNPPSKLASLHFAADADVRGVLDQAEVTYPWLLVPGSKFVAKPDQLIKRRGKSGLLALNKTWAEAKEWIAERAGKPQQVEHVEGVLRQFLVEPFVPHPQDTEYYININSVREVRFQLFPFFVKYEFFVGADPNSASVATQEAFCMCGKTLQRDGSVQLAFLHGRAGWFCFPAGSDEGEPMPSPLLQSTYNLLCARPLSHVKLSQTASFPSMLRPFQQFPRFGVAALSRWRTATAGFCQSIVFASANISALG